MCNLSKGVREKGIAEGLEKGRLEGRAEGMAESPLTSVRNLMETLGLSLDAATAALKIPEVDRPRYAKQLNE